MAITLVGAGEASAINGGDPSITLPGGIADGDTVYTALTSWSTTLSMTTSGYTEIEQKDQNQLDQCSLSISRKRMSGTPDSTAVGNGDGGALNGVSMVSYTLAGVDSTTPEDVAETTAGGRSTNPNNASITPSTSGAWVLACAASAVLDTTVTAPSGYSDQVDVSANDSQDTTVGMARKEWASGAEDPAAWTTWSSGTWAAVTVAVRPASSSNVTGTAAITLAAITSDSTGAAGASGTAAIVLTAITVSSTGAAGASGTAAITLSAITVSGTGAETFSGTAEIILAAVTSAATGAAGASGTAAITLPAVSVDGDGEEAFIGTAEIILSPVTVDGTGLEQFIATASIVLASMLADATGAAGASGTAEITLSAVEVNADGTAGAAVVLTVQRFKYIGIGMNTHG